MIGEGPEKDRSWLSVHLVYAPPWEEFLVSVVKPFVDLAEEEGWVEQYFFVRYGDRGPHIRLRLRGEERILNGILRDQLTAHFNDFFVRVPSIRKPQPLVADEQLWWPNNSIQFVPYEPETQRYGGEIGIRVAERQFHASSKAVLSALNEAGTWNEGAALATALVMHSSLLKAFGLAEEDVRVFFQAIFENTRAGLKETAYVDNWESIRKSFEQGFQIQKDLLLSIQTAIWREEEEEWVLQASWLGGWMEEMTEVGREFRQLAVSLAMEANDAPRYSQGARVLWPIIGSYLHMTNNRLGLSRPQEAYLGFLLGRSFPARNPEPNL